MSGKRAKRCELNLGEKVRIRGRYRADAMLGPPHPSLSPIEPQDLGSTREREHKKRNIKPCARGYVSRFFERPLDAVMCADRVPGKPADVFCFARLPANRRCPVGAHSKSDCRPIQPQRQNVISIVSESSIMIPRAKKYPNRHESSGMLKGETRVSKFMP